MTSGDAIGFSGGTEARLNLLNNVDFNTKEFLYYDTDLHCLMCYKPTVLQFLQYNGQVIGTVPNTTTPIEGDLWVGTERVYTWDDINKFWKIQLHEWIRKHEPVQDGYTSHRLNGAELRIHRDNSDNMWISVYQNIGMDTLLYSLDDSTPTKLVLAQDNEQILVPSNIGKGVEHLLSTELAHDGNGQSVTFIRYENTIFIVQSSKILVGDTTFTSMTTVERILYSSDKTKTKKRFVFDSDLGVLMHFIPNIGQIGSFVEYKGQGENGSFPCSGLTDGQNYISNGNSYTYNITNQYWNLNEAGTSLKNNMNATSAPTINDDNSKGYSAGSIWVYNSVTYTCQDDTKDHAIWISDADITYFDDWTSAVSDISVAGSTYVNKYISVTNANGAPNSGATYTAPGTISNPIADGGTAVYKVLTQGTNYSVTCQKRVIMNPILTAMVTFGATLPSITGYYGFLGLPTGGYPVTINQGDIGFYDGSTWSRFQTYATASNTVLVGSGISQITWYKQGGTWSNSYTRVTLDNQTVSTILPSSSSVNIAEFIEIPQITASINLTLPLLTNGTQAKRVVILNTGNVSFTINKYIVNPNNYIIFVWSPQNFIWTSPENQRLKLTLDQRLSLTAYDGMTVYQTDGNIQGDWKYSGALSAWTPQNFNTPVTSIMTTATTKPTVNGVYIFNITPTDGLPSGIVLYDISSLYNGIWYKVFSYANAPTSVMVGTGTSQVEYVKNGGTWTTIVGLTNTKAILSNQTSSGILIASNTVDICEYLEVNQSTTNISLTLPNLTVTIKPKRLIVMNTGTVEFLINNYAVNPNDFVIFVWSPSKLAWVNQETQLTDKAWQANVLYKTGTKVLNGNTLLECRTDHLSASVNPYNFIADFKAGRWSVIGGDLLSISHIDRVTITSPYNGMQVYQNDSYMYGVWEYNSDYNAWKLLDITPFTPIVVRGGIDSIPTSDGLYIFNGYPTNGFPSASNGTITYGCIASRVSGTWYLEIVYSAIPASISVYNGSSSQIETWIKTVSSGWIANVDISSTQTLTNKTLVDSSTIFVDDQNVNRKAQLKCDNITANQTRVLTVPDTNLTLDGIPPTWQAGVQYIQGMRVMYNNTILQAKSTHTSGQINPYNFITDFQNGKWIVVGGELLQMTTSQISGIQAGALYNGLSVYSTDGTVGKWTYRNSAWTFEPVIDTLTSSVVDIGNTRIQRFSGFGSGVASGTFTFSKPFANTSYSLSVTMIMGGDGNAAYTANVYNKTTTQFSFHKRWNNDNSSGDATSETIDIIAIGDKP